MVILIHLASTNVPYTSESKEAVASIPEIVEELRLALQEAGRKLREYLERKSRIERKKKKESELFKIIPLLAEKVSEVLEREVPDYEKVVARIMGSVYISRSVFAEDGRNFAVLKIANYSKYRRKFKVYEMSSGDIKAEKKVGNSAIFEVELMPEEEVEIKYEFTGKLINKKPLVEGLSEDEIIGGEVVSF